MKLLLRLILSSILFTEAASARALIGALNTPISFVDSKADMPAPQNKCSTFNSFGFQNPSFSSRSEIFKILKIRNIASQELSTERLQVLKNQFMQATSVYRNSFDLDSSSTPVLIQTRARLLGAIGYNEKRLDQSMKAELLKQATEDPRWKAALQKLSCVLLNCKSSLDLAIPYENLIVGKNFKKDLETALLEQESEQITVDEMLGGMIIPTERARLRIFSALLSQLDIPSETRWSCSKTPTGIQFSARLEVTVGKDTWASDTALASDYVQKAAQLCFSSLEKLSEQCGKKGASL